MSKNLTSYIKLQGDAESAKKELTTVKTQLKELQKEYNNLSLEQQKSKIKGTEFSEENKLRLVELKHAISDAKGEVTELGTQLKDSAAAAKKAFEEANNSTGKFKEGLADAVLQLAAVGGGIGLLNKGFAKFTELGERGFAAIDARAGGLAPTLQRLATVSANLFSERELSPLVKYMQSLGMTTREMENLVKVSIKTARVLGLDFKQALDMWLNTVANSSPDALKKLGLQVKLTGDALEDKQIILDAVSRSVENYNVTLEHLGEKATAAKKKSDDMYDSIAAKSADTYLKYKNTIDQIGLGWASMVAETASNVGKLVTLITNAQTKLEGLAGHKKGGISELHKPRSGEKVGSRNHLKQIAKDIAEEAAWAQKGIKLDKQNELDLRKGFVVDLNEKDENEEALKKPFIISTKKDTGKGSSKASLPKTLPTRRSSVIDPTIEPKFNTATQKIELVENDFSALISKINNIDLTPFLRRYDDLMRNIERKMQDEYERYETKERKHEEDRAAKISKIEELEKVRGEGKKEALYEIEKIKIELHNAEMARKEEEASKDKELTRMLEDSAIQIVRLREDAFAKSEAEKAKVSLASSKIQNKKTDDENKNLQRLAEEKEKHIDLAYQDLAMSGLQIAASFAQGAASGAAMKQIAESMAMSFAWEGAGNILKGIASQAGTWGVPQTQSTGFFTAGMGQLALAAALGGLSAALPSPSVSSGGGAVSAYQSQHDYQDDKKTEARQESQAVVNYYVISRDSRYKSQKDIQRYVERALEGR